MDCGDAWDDPVYWAIERIKSANLMPPVKAIHALEKRDVEYLEIIVWSSWATELEQAITRAAFPVPVEMIWIDYDS